MPNSELLASATWMLPASVLVAGVLIATSILLASERTAEAAERKLTGCLAFIEEEFLREHNAPSEEQRDDARRAAATVCYQGR